MGNRMSSLELSQYCGRAGGLNSASGRAAVQGSYYHAVQAGEQDASDWGMKLTPEEREEVESWYPPADLVIEGWGTFSYQQAVKEVTVGLDEHGGYWDEGKTIKCVSLGHIDAAWVVGKPLCRPGRHHPRLAVICDLKKSRFTVDGPTTLQNVAYGMAWAAKHNCTHLVMDIWAATEGEHITSKVIDLWSEEAGDMLSRVLHAAQNVDPDNPVMGTHCKKCFGWQRCDAYTVAASSTEGMGDEQEITADNAARLLMEAEAHVRFGDLAKKRLQLFANTTPILSEDGNRRWASTIMKGKKSVMGVKKLEEKLGKEEAAKLITRGPEFPQYRWTNTEQGAAVAKKRSADKAKAARKAKKEAATKGES